MDRTPVLGPAYSGGGAEGAGCNWVDTVDRICTGAQAGSDAHDGSSTGYRLIAAVAVPGRGYAQQWQVPP